MISQESIKQYHGHSLSRGSNFLYVSPHFLLRPYIANYTVSFPTSETMPDDYTILPTASSTLTFSVSSDRMISGLRGVNTIPCKVGAAANKMKLLLLIEFHPGGLYPFIPVNHSELLDRSFKLNEINKKLGYVIEEELIRSDSIETLIAALDRIFIKQLAGGTTSNDTSTMLRYIITQHGDINSRRLSDEFYYSEKHIRRLFLQYVGTSPKMFSRIVRTNYALHLIQSHPCHLTGIAMQAGFFDQPHFIHDFKTVCGLTPQEYIRNMSVFYNDQYKM